MFVDIYTFIEYNQNAFGYVSEGHPFKDGSTFTIQHTEKETDKWLLSLSRLKLKMGILE